MPDGIGAIGLARRCHAALKTLIDLETTGTVPGPAQLAALEGWSGWGPLAKAFDWNDDQGGAWAQLKTEVTSLLDPSDLAAAKNATDTAFYTPPLIARACWAILTGLGFTGGTVLDPGCGHGVFKSAAPATMPLRWTGVEADRVTARIATLLHPDADIIGARLEKTPLARGSFDAAAGNVPFSQAGPYDPGAPKLNLHNYFIWRALAATRPGGLVVLVTSRWTLDANQPEQRQELAKLGALIGAIRLPSCALAGGGTEAVADILILRRHPAGETAGPAGDPDWVKPARTPRGSMTPVSEYFRRNPGMVVGTMTDRGGVKFGQSLEVILPDDSMLPSMLADAIRQVIKTGRNQGLTWYPAPEPSDLPPGCAETAAGDGIFTLHADGTITQQRGQHHAPVKATSELTALIRLRDAAVPLFASETDQTISDLDRARIRRDCRDLYRDYVTEYGPLNRSTLHERTGDDGEVYLTRRRPPMGGFKADPDFVTVLALEIWDDDTETATPAPILLRHVNAAPERKTSTTDPGEALLLCLDKTGRVDLPEIAALLGVSAGQVPGLLPGLIWDDPETGQWVTADEYLSGNVRGKLTAARAAAGTDPDRYGAHVTALEQVQPDDLPPERINAQLGSPWIPPAVIEQFIADLLVFTNGHQGKHVRVHFVPLTSAWEVHASTQVRQISQATTVWGTLRVNAVNLIEDALNGTVPEVWDSYPDGSRVRNPEETQLAAERIRSLQEQFAEWVWSAPKRTTRLTGLYNKRFNSDRVRRYDGSLLTFPGMSGAITPYQSQRDSVWRAVCTPASLCGDAVGGGKTATMVMTAMTLRRLGLARKPCMVVPNHLLEQETAEARRLYPGARILMVTRDDLTPTRRRYFAAKCAARDLDLVILTHQQFTALPVSPQVKAAYIARQITELEQAIMDQPEETRTVKQLARRKRKKEAELERLLDTHDTSGLTFEQTGLDYVLYDEGHALKNLETSARAEGFSTAGSKRADDACMKFGYLRQQYGRCGSLFTATPISNQLLELHILFRYVAPDELERRGLTSFDAFAAQFIRYETTTEVTPDGSGFRSYRRPQRYCNLPELRQMLGQVADIRTKKTLNLPGPRVDLRHIAVPGQPELEPFTAELVARADRIRRGLVRPTEDNMLSVCTDGRRGALDLRLTGIDQPTGPGKVDVVAAKVLECYRKTSGNIYSGSDRPGGVQLVYCDQGTPSKTKGSQVYGWLRDELISGGIPRDQIAFVHDATTDGDKSALFRACRNGTVRVMLVSTEKGGTGLNIQRRLTTIHHMDAPWKPSCVQQRDGRGDRPGNENEVLEVYRYVTERSFDSYMWQALERKQAFIAQILTGDLAAREVEDAGDPTTLTYAELKAMATGQPLLLELSKINNEIARLRSLASAHTRSAAKMRADYHAALETARNGEGRARQATLITEASQDAGFVLRAGGQDIPSAQAPWRLAEVLSESRKHKRKQTAGQWRGVHVNVEPVWYQRGAPGVRVELEASLYSGFAHTWVSEVRRPWNAVEGAAALLAEIDEHISEAAGIAAQAAGGAGEARRQAAELKPRLDQEFPYRADLLIAQRLRAELEAEIDAQVEQHRPPVAA